MFPSTNIELNPISAPHSQEWSSQFLRHVLYFFEPLENTALVSAASSTPAFGGHEEQNIFFVVVLEKSLLEPRLALDLLCSYELAPPISSSQVLGLQICTIMSDLEHALILSTVQSGSTMQG